MAEDTIPSPLKRSFSPGLEDEVTAIATKAARTTGPSDDLDDYMKRWLAAGICLHTVISPVLREYILPVIIKLYYRLTNLHQIDRQTYSCFLPTYYSKKLNYETINNNKNLFGKSQKRYDYRVQNPIELSKLFLQTHMTKYQYIDDSCDSSALLGIIINIDDFPVSVRTNSEKVRSTVRNPWAHCNFPEWDNGKFSTTFRDMESLIKSLTINVSKKKTVLDELTKWETHGTRCVFQGTTLGLELVKEISKETCAIAKYAKVLKCIIANDMENKVATDKVIQDELRALKEKIQAITECQEEIIPKHIQDDYQDEIRAWEKDDETFVETRATEHVMSWLSKYNIALVTGSSGTGKSFLIHHVALQLRRLKQYDIIPLLFVNAPSTIMNYYSKSRNQVFIVDDICGKGTINVQLVNLWKDITEKIKDRFKSNSTDTEGTMNSKLLISCRLQVFNDLQFKGLTLFTENAFDLLSKPFRLLPEERILMLKKYIKSEKIDDVIELIFEYDFFPLMCKMSKNISYENLNLFFASPVNTIKEQIQNIIDSSNKPQLCALILSVLFGEGFKEDWLTCRLKAMPKILRNKLKRIARHCEIDLKSEFARRSLKNGFSALEGTFLRKVGTKYSVIHDKICEIASTVCGQHLMECFIRYANGSFIGERYIFRSIETNPTDVFIALPEEMEEEYFERLIEDLKQLDVYSTLYNKQLVHKSFRQKLIKYMSNNAENVQDLFNQIEKNGIRLDTDEVFLYWNKTDKTVSKVEDGVTIVTYPLIEAATEGYADIVELLIGMNCNVNKTDSYGRSALYTACKVGHVDVVEILINHNADVSLCSKEESSPLHMACKTGSINIVNLLLSKSVDVCKLDRYHISPLREACEQGNVNIVRLLLQNETDVNMSDILMGFCPLHSACEAGHLDVVQCLLENQSDVNRVSHFGDTPLSLACKGGYADIVKELLNYNAKVSAELSDKSPLYFACKTGNGGLVKMLLANSTDIYPYISTKVSGFDAMCSPVCVASKRNHINILQLLLQKCSNKISSIDKCGSLCMASLNGCLDIVKLLFENTDLSSFDELMLSIDTPMYFACRGGYIEIVQYFLTQHINIFQCSTTGRSLLHATCEGFREGEGHNCVIKLLIENQLDISKPDEKGLSPLHLACENGLLSICKLLIRNKADINMQDIDKRSPLHVACQRKNYDIVEVLLENKANIELCDNAGKTALHVICERFKDLSYLRPIIATSLMCAFEMFVKCKSIVKSLIDLEADVNSPDSEGETPLHTSCTNGDDELVKLLLSSKKSNINLQNRKGQTALYIACRSGFKNIVTLLLDQKADIYKADKEGKSPTCILREERKSIIQFRNFFKSINNDNIAKYLESTIESYSNICGLCIAYQIKNKCRRSKETDKMQMSINKLSK